MSDAFTSESSAAKHGRQKLLSSVRQNSSAVGRLLLRDARPQSFFSPGGIYLGEVYSVSVDMGRVLAWIIRGLFFSAEGNRIPPDYKIESQRLDPLRYMDGIEKTLQMGYYARFRVGTEFFANLMVSEWDPFATMWLLCFYQSIWIYVETSPPNASE